MILVQFQSFNNKKSELSNFANSKCNDESNVPYVEINLFIYRH